MRSDGSLRLALLRHAKSDWSAPGQPDHERPLSLRGRLAAPLMGAWLAEQPWRIDLAMVSTAVRAQETWTRLSPLLPEKPVVWSEKDLYHAAPDEMMRILRSAPSDAETVLMIGHNPGLEDFANTLTSPVAGEAVGDFPTAAIGVFRLEAKSWGKADFGRFALEAYEKPKTLV